MPTIRIDDEVWGELKKRAEPLVDSANDVLRRVFSLNGNDATKGAEHGGGGNGTTKTKYGKTPRRNFIMPILVSVAELNGKGRTMEVLKRVYDKVNNDLTDEDRVPHKSGEQSWRNSARWAREIMTKEFAPPLLNPSSPHGWWEITEAGKKYLKHNG